MNIFSGIFSKWKKTESSDDFKVVLKTDKKLSEEQKDAIITITKAGILSDVAPSNIAIKIMEITGIYDMIILNRTENGVEVII